MAGGLRRGLLALAAVVLVGALGLAAPARAATTVLYDGAAAGESPADQGYFDYGTFPEPPAAATLSAAGAGATLDSSGEPGDYAGFVSRAGALPPLSRTLGYTVTFTAQVLSETHELADRAGFVLVVLGDDRWGIELSLWEDEVWAQNDGAHDPTPGRGLFTHGEGAALATTAGPVRYSVAVKGDRYTLLADGVAVLGGPLRQYNPPLNTLTNPLRAVYYLNRLIFLGDNTSRAGASTLLTGVTLETATAPTGETPSPQPSETPSPQPSETPSPAPRARVFLPAIER